MAFITSILQKVASDIGAEIIIEPEYRLVGYITFKNGKKLCFSRSKLNINGYGSATLAKDKAFSHFFLKNFGYAVPEGQTFFSKKLCTRLGNPRDIDEGFSFAKKIGFPVIVKPLKLSQGILVTKVHNRKEYYKAAEEILEITSAFMVEKFCMGNDYRIVVIDDEVAAAYQRIPLSVVGDGESSIFQLVQQKKASLLSMNRKTIFDLNDFRIYQKLQRQNLDFNSIISQNTRVYLLDNANLSSGGEAVDLTDSIHSDFQKLAVNIAKDMALRLAGVDIITSNITEPIGDYYLLEVNGSPGLEHYAAIGEIQIKRVENLYLKVLQALERT